MRSSTICSIAKTIPKYKKMIPQSEKETNYGGGSWKISTLKTFWWKFLIQKKRIPVNRATVFKQLRKRMSIKEFYSFSGDKGDNNKTELGLILKFLQSRYPDLDVTDLEKIFKDRKNNLTNTCAQLDFQHRPIEIMDVSFRSENISESFLLEVMLDAPAWSVIFFREETSLFFFSPVLFRLCLYCGVGKFGTIWGKKRRCEI